MRTGLLAAVVLALGIAPLWAEQQTPKSSFQSTTAGKTSASKTAKSTRSKSGKAPAESKGKTTTTASAKPGAGKRDPFKLPEYPTGKPGMPFTNAAGGVLPPGVRGLLIGPLRLEGVVRQQVNNKMIAVVTNETRRAYFLTENESVYNGVVTKITPDSVYFKENVLDADGRVTTREVVKRLGAAPGEGR